MGRWVVLWMFYAFPLLKWVRFVMMSISVTFNFLSNVISKGMNRFHIILSSPTGLFQPVVRPPGVSFSWNVTTREPFCGWWAPRGAVVGCACSSYSLLSVRWFPRFLGAWVGCYFNCICLVSRLAPSTRWSSNPPASSVFFLLSPRHILISFHFSILCFDLSRIYLASLP